MPRRADVYLELALTALQHVATFVAGVPRDRYLADIFVQSAVERQLEIAGDAIGQLRKHAPDYAARIPEADLIVAFRNVLAHGYASLDHGRVFEAATNHAPRLCEIVETLLKEFPNIPRPDNAS